MGVYIPPIPEKKKVEVTLTRLLPGDHFDKMGWYALIAMCGRESAYDAFKDIGHQHPAFGDLTSNIFEYYYIHNSDGEEIGRFTLRRVSDNLYNFGSFSIYPQHQSKGYATAVLRQLVELYPEHMFELYTNSAYLMRAMARLGWVQTGFIKDDHSENALFKYTYRVYITYKGPPLCS